LLEHCSGLGSKVSGFEAWGPGFRVLGLDPFGKHAASGHDVRGLGLVEGFGSIN
jgi:hypothetical protein